MQSLREPDVELPRWFVVPLAIALCGLLSLTIVGSVLAMLGVFRPLLVVPTVCGATALAAWVLVPRLPTSRPTAATHTWVALVVLGASAVGLWNAANHAEHLIIERDPAIYLTSARWLVDSGSLLIEPPPAPPFDARTDLFRTSPGITGREDGRIETQFPHGLPVVAAPAGWLDTDLLFVVNPLLGSLALLTVFAAAATVARPFWAAAASGALALTFTMVYFSRDMYSEPLVTALLFGGLWLMRAVPPDRMAVGLIVGALFGATCSVRIDGYISLIPLALVIGVWLRHTLSTGRRSLSIGLVGVALGSGAAAFIGWYDTRFFSEVYYRSDLGPNIRPMVMAACIAFVGGAVVAPLLWTLRSDTWRPRRLLGVATASVVVGGTLLIGWMALLRPRSVDLPDLANQMEGRLADYDDVAGRLSYRWLEWYLGRPAVLTGFVGLLALLVVGLHRRRDARDLLLPGVVLATAILYLWSPRITPDQPWAMRRFAAIAMPGLVVGAFWVASKVWNWRPRPVQAAGPLLAVLAIAMFIVPIVSATRPLRNVRVGSPTDDIIDAVCAVTSAEPSAVLVAPGALLNLTLPSTIAAWCEVPTAGSREQDADDVIALAREWQKEDRRLVVVASSPEPWDGAFGRGQPLPQAALAAPEVTVGRRPEKIVPDERIAKPPGSVLSMYVLIVDTE